MSPRAQDETVQSLVEARGPVGSGHDDIWERALPSNPSLLVDHSTSIVIDRRHEHIGAAATLDTRGLTSTSMATLVPREAGLTAGPIAGIVIGCVVAIGILVCVLIPSILSRIRRRPRSAALDLEDGVDPTAGPIRKDSDRRLSSRDFGPVSGKVDEVGGAPPRRPVKQFSSYDSYDAAAADERRHDGAGVLPSPGVPARAFQHQPIFAATLEDSPSPAAIQAEPEMFTSGHVMPAAPISPPLSDTGRELSQLRIAGSQSPEQPHPGPSFSAAVAGPAGRADGPAVEMQALGGGGVPPGPSAAPPAVEGQFLSAPGPSRPALNASYYDPNSSLNVSRSDLGNEPAELPEFEPKGLTKRLSRMMSSSSKPARRDTFESHVSQRSQPEREDSLLDRVFRRITGRERGSGASAASETGGSPISLTMHDEPQEMDDDEMRAVDAERRARAAAGPTSAPGSGGTRGLPGAGLQRQSTLPEPHPALKAVMQQQQQGRTRGPVQEGELVSPADADGYGADFGIMPPSGPAHPTFLFSSQPPSGSNKAGESSSAGVNPMDIMRPSNRIEEKWHVDQELQRIETAAASARAGVSPANAFPVLPDPDDDDYDAMPSSPESDGAGNVEPQDPTDFPTPADYHTDVSNHPTPDSRLTVETPPSSKSDEPDTEMGGTLSLSPHLEPGSSAGVEATPSPTPSRGFGCNECGRTFDQIHKLNHHKRYHDRPHECPHHGCDKRFGTKTHLDRHINDKHNKTRKYYCTESTCQYSRQGGKSFPRKDNWRRHMVNKHELGAGSDREPDVDDIMGGT